MVVAATIRACLHPQLYIKLISEHGASAAIWDHNSDANKAGTRKAKAED